MPYGRKKGGSALMALAKRRKLKAAKDKEDTLEPMVIKPALSRLRTGTIPKRKKGGQTLMDLAKRRKKPAAKKPASSQSRKFGSRIPVGSRSSKTAAQRKSPVKRKTPTTRTSKLAPGAGGALRGGTIKATKAPSIFKRAKDYLTKTREGKVLGLMGEAGLTAAGGKTALKAGQMVNKKRKLRSAGRAGGQATARKRQAAAGEKTAKAYEQFEKDRKLRSRNRRRRN
tara:strand:+ start:803 stop:1483 length:681 start_codon:yes stop_codon:yes gene_type:complete